MMKKRVRRLTALLMGCLVLTNGVNVFAGSSSGTIGTSRIYLKCNYEKSICVNWMKLCENASDIHINTKQEVVLVS